MWEILAIASGSVMLGLARYRSTQQSRLAEHPTRLQILQEVEEDPGINLAELRRRVGCSWGTLQHHVRLLTKSRLVRACRWNRSRRLFPPRLEEDNQRPLLLLQSGRIREIVDEVIARPGIIQREITDGVGVSRKVLRRYVDILKSEGLLTEVTVARSRAYFPTDELEAAMSRLDDPRDATLPAIRQGR